MESQSRRGNAWKTFCRICGDVRKGLAPQNALTAEDAEKPAEAAEKIVCGGDRSTSFPVKRIQGSRHYPADMGSAAWRGLAFLEFGCRTRVSHEE